MSEYLRFAFTSDLHLDRRSPEAAPRWERFFAELGETRPDVVVLCGDIVGLDKEGPLRELGAALDRHVPDAQRLFVPGNHDLWQRDPDRDTERFYAGELAALFRETAGLSLLDGAPRVLGGTIGVVGSLGWYDYSLAAPGLVLGPRDSYERKTFHGHRVWNDARWTSIEDDRAFCARLVAQLDADIDEVKRRGARRVVAITHTLAFAEMVRSVHEKPLWTFAQAFHGSTALGEVIAGHAEVALHVCGHTHLPAEMRVGGNGLVSVNVGGGYDRPRSFVRDVPL